MINAALRSALLMLVATSAINGTIALRTELGRLAAPATDKNMNVDSRLKKTTNASFIGGSTDASQLRLPATLEKIQYDADAMLAKPDSNA